MNGMILAAGLGTRLKPFTDKHPKALYPINGITVLQRNIEYLQTFDIKNVIVNVHHFADQIINTIAENNGWGSNISISNETDEVLETGGGLKKAAPFFENSNDPFVLMNADILTDLSIDNMLLQHQNNNPLATIATTNRETSRYLMFDNDNKLCGWYNEKTAEQKGNIGNKKAFSGIHIISPTIFNLITETGKFSMIDLYLRLAESGYSIMSYDHSDGIFIDIGKPESAVQAEVIWR